MITVGLVREMTHISQSLNTPLSVTIQSPRMRLPLMANLIGGFLEVFYSDGEARKIWREEVAGPQSMFGVESVDSIFRIIHLIDSGSQNWREFVYLE